jgi:hypothetical protein
METLIEPPIEQEVRWAQRRYEGSGPWLLHDERTCNLLGRLKKCIHASSTKLKETGISDICRRCDREEGGSCCGAGLENRFDRWLLLINLLMGVEIPKKPHDPHSCRFLGKTGCLLMAREVICVNYLCKSITERIYPEEILALQEKEGKELNTLFLLKEHIKNLLADPAVAGCKGKKPTENTW